MQQSAAEVRDAAADKATELKDKAADKAGEVRGLQVPVTGSLGDPVCVL
jgi:hypothetical protein